MYHRKWKCNQLLWKHLHLLQRISDSPLLSPKQHDRACHLRTRYQLLRKLLSPGSTVVSLGWLFRRLWTACGPRHGSEWNTNSVITSNTARHGANAYKWCTHSVHQCDVCTHRGCCYNPVCRAERPRECLYSYTLSHLALSSCPVPCAQNCRKFHHLITIATYLTIM